MRKLSALALVVLALWGSDARAIELKNVRLSYGPFGAERPSAKLQPGDVLMINFDMHGLTIDPKNGLTKWTRTMVVTDPKGKQIDTRTENNALLIGLGGNVVPEMIPVITGYDLMPGKYNVKITITDGSNKMKKDLVQDFELLPKEFGFVHVVAPAVGIKGQDYAVEYALVSFGLDSKTKAPRITLTVRVLDESGKLTTSEPIVLKIPDDLPAGTWEKQQELIRLRSPVFLNRPGRFTVEVEALDETSKKTSKISYPLTVVDPAGK